MKQYMPTGNTRTRYFGYFLATKSHSGAVQRPERDGLSESGRPDGYHAGKRGLYGHEERRILSSGREDDPVRAPVHVESEHAPARPDLYRAAYGKVCE